MSSKHDVLIQEDQTSEIQRLRKELLQVERTKNSHLEKMNHALEQRNTALKKKLTSLAQRNTVLERQAEKYRAAALAIAEIATHLPSAQIDCLEWAKEVPTPKYLTMRTKEIAECRKLIQAQPKYAALDDGFLVENNALHADNQFKSALLTKIKQFVRDNCIGNTNPSIKLRSDRRAPLDEVLGIRDIKREQLACREMHFLVGEKGVYAKQSIPRDTILGQYVGAEMHKEQFEKMYCGTREEMEHLSFMHGETVQVSDGQTFDLYVDGIAATSRASPLLYSE